jgi:hypothetical protein
MNIGQKYQNRANVLNDGGNKKAFVLRIKPSGKDRLPEALENDQIIIGWANALGLLNKKLDKNNFKKIIQNGLFRFSRTFELKSVDMLTYSRDKKQP